MLFFNEDWLHFLWTRFEENTTLNEEVLKEFIYQYKGTKITDFCLNVNGTVSSAKSTVAETFVDIYYAEKENGIAVDYKNTYAKTAHYINEELGLDQYKIWVDALREINIRPWISIRMNDCHGNGAKTDIRKSSFVEKRKDLWRVRHREFTEYFDKCVDYSLPEVRNSMLSYIEEMLENYAPDGLELDFTREMNLFPIGVEYDSFSVLTEFLGNVYNLVKKQEEKCGHEIKIGVLVGANITATFNQGFDVKGWSDMGLVDFVTILPRWETINTNMDIGLWKKLIGGNVKLGTGLQLLVYNPDGAKMALIDHDFGQVAANLSMGADFIYLYNHFDTTEEGLEPFKVKNSIREPENLKVILNNIADLDTVMNFKRRHILTYDDYAPLWENQNRRLPLTLDNTHKQIRIAVGKIKENSKVELVLGFTEEINVEKLKVYVNSKRVEFKCVGGRYDGKGFSYTYTIPEDAIKTYAVAELSSEDEPTLNFAEIIVCRRSK